MNNKTLLKGALFLLVLICVGGFVEAQEWCDDSYAYRREVVNTFHTNLEDFPYLIGGPSGANMSGTTKLLWGRSDVPSTNYLYYNNASDFAYYDEDCSELPVEENSNNQGNNPTEVWDSFLGVYHLENIEALTKDSTSNDLDLEKSGIPSVSDGIFGNAIYFNSYVESRGEKDSYKTNSSNATISEENDSFTTEFVRAATIGEDWYETTSSSLWIGNSDFTISFWMKTTDKNKPMFMIDDGAHWSRNTNFIICSVRTICASILDNCLVCGYSDGEGDIGPECETNFKINDEEWHHVTFVAERSKNMVIYVDGEDETNSGSSQYCSERDTGSIDTDHISIGGGSTESIGMNEVLDEFRLTMGTALSANEVEATYLQSKEGFSKVGPEEPIGPYCGNGICEEGEDFDNCPADCTAEEKLKELQEEISQIKSELGNLTKKVSSMENVVGELVKFVSSIQNTLNNFIGKITAYLTQFPKDTRKQILCSYMGENNLTEYSDLGLDCKIIQIWGFKYCKCN